MQLYMIIPNDYYFWRLQSLLDNHLARYSMITAAGQQHLPGRSASSRSMAARVITAAAGT